MGLGELFFAVAAARDRLSGTAALIHLERDAALS